MPMSVSLTIDRLVFGFDRDTFRSFINEKFSGNFALFPERITVDDNEPWVGAEWLGVVKVLPGTNGVNRPLAVAIAGLPEGAVLHERSSRLKQFRFARKVLEDAVANPAPDLDGLLSQGLFVFFDEQGNFRLSLVYATPKGTKLEWSSAKRFSFYVEVGAGNKTFRDRARLPWNAFDTLSDAFSVEKLTKEFYGRLFDWYQWTMDAGDVVFPNDIVTDKEPGAVKSEQIIRLITRLMFVWFLKQKHLVPDKLFDPAELDGILKRFSSTEGDNYYRAILQNLFFATLNSEISERDFAIDAGNLAENREHFDIKTLYRYGGEFAVPKDDVLRLFHSVPFLNGGLFECLDRGSRYLDGFSRRKNKQAKVPNKYFFDENQGLIPLLGQYNFTVEENSPGDEEVALDPELLGKVFENLLAAYNPETQEQARRATGSFYTPREIVNYMVDESLIAHLKTHCGEEHEEAIRRVLSDAILPSDNELTRRIDEAITSIRVLDPACGSGAFPMGMLLRIVDVLRVVRGIPEEASTYDLKLELIENAIYGADIQTIAVQISKLRFFISLISEQEPTDNPRDNYGIRSLPNLETKFVAANSLIRIDRKNRELLTEDAEELKRRLWLVRHEHFQARSYQVKKELRKQDEMLRSALAASLMETGGFDNKSAQLMAGWDPYDQNASADFLDSEWMFNVRSGFDVVIANPPYLGNKEIGSENQEAYELYFGFKNDMYVYFIFKGVELVTGSGILVYVTSNTFLTLDTKLQARKLLQRLRLIEICDIGKAFESAVVYAAILIVKNEERRDDYGVRVYAGDPSNSATVKWKGRIGLYRNSLNRAFFPATPLNVRLNELYASKLSAQKATYWSLISKATLSRDGRSVLSEKVDQTETGNVLLLGLLFEGAQGLVTGNNSRYLARICEDEGEEKEVFNLLKTKLAKYVDVTSLSFEDRKAAYGIAEELKKQHEKPALFGKRFLYRTVKWSQVVRFEDLSTEEQQNGCSTETWVVYHRGNNEGYRWRVPQIECIDWSAPAVRELREGRITNSRWQGESYFDTTGLGWVDYFTDKLKAFFVPPGPYSKNTIKFHSRTGRVPDRFLVGLLNSQFISYFVRTFISNTRTLQVNHGKLIPVVLPTEDQQTQIVDLVSSIVRQRQSDPHAEVTDLERRIDVLVYDLYGVRSSEVAILEADAPVSALHGETEPSRTVVAGTDAESTTEPKLPASRVGWE